MECGKRGWAGGSVTLVDAVYVQKCVSYHTSVFSFSILFQYSLLYTCSVFSFSILYCILALHFFFSGRMFCSCSGIP